MRVLRLRILAVKNSMKRRLARSPWARTIAGSASSPARISAGGGLISITTLGRRKKCLRNRSEKGQLRALRANQM